jgi:hypothetical protein
MISSDVAGALIEKLNFVGDVDHAAAMRPGFAFDLDFDSSVRWPDLPYDTASPLSRYDQGARPLILETLEAAASIFRARAPKAWVFVNEELDRAMIRQSGAVVGASSSSNRELVGSCLLTNLHVAPDRVAICLEALVHEAIHQHLYRTELRLGNFCDLGDTGRYRSPWSGNRIPLHSLIHASLVWFGLLGLWCQLRKGLPGRGDDLGFQGRVAATLFGFAYLRQIMEAPGFPRNSVQPRIAEMIAHIGQVTDFAARAQGRGRLCDSLRSSEDGAWVTELCSALEGVQGSWKRDASTVREALPAEIGGTFARVPWAEALR